MLTPRTCNTKQLYTTLSKNTGSIRQRWIELFEKEARKGQWCCVEKHWDMKCWFSAMAMCPIIVFEFWGQEVSSIALRGSNESVSELFLSLPRQYKELFSSLCPTVRLISKLMVSVAKIMWDYCTFSFVTYKRAVRLKRSKINTDLIVHNTFHQPQSLFWDHLIFPTSAGPPSTWSGPNEKVKIWGRYPSNCLHQGKNDLTCCCSNLAVYSNVLQVSWYVSHVAC